MGWISVGISIKDYLLHDLLNTYYRIDSIYKI